MTSFHRDRVDAVIFDLDGVLTDTARLHARAWKDTFDPLLRRLGLPEFDPDTDYRRHVDGRPRLDGAREFLRARGLQLPEGTPEEPPGQHSVHALGRAKAARYRELLEREGARVLPGARRLLQALRRAGFHTAVVSASRNAGLILHRTGLGSLLDVRVDGQMAAQAGLAGKPAPDTFLHAARLLGVSPQRAAVLEDALAGVQAADAGGFDTVIGVARRGDPRAFREHGADLVIRGLGDLGVAAAGPHREVGGSSRHGGWRLWFRGLDPALEGTREVLCTLGNGYLATRGAPGAVDAHPPHYPGSYLAGGYDRLASEVAGRRVDNEDLVNLPNWLPLRVWPEGGAGWEAPGSELLDYARELDLRHGELRLRQRWRDAGGRVLEVEELRLVHMADAHLAASLTTVTAPDWSGELRVEAGLDGRVRNAGVERYRALAGEHLRPRAVRAAPGRLELEMETRQSGLRLAWAARLRLAPGAPADTSELHRQPARCAQSWRLAVSAGRPRRIEKLCALYTSRDRAISAPAEAAAAAVAGAPAFSSLRSRHRLAWALLWRRFDVDLRDAHGRQPGHILMLLRLHLFHLLQVASPNLQHVDAGVPARGLHGEAYRGHVFWDELFILPSLTLRMPEITRSLLMYRWHRLGAAREAARGLGCRGAMYPWQSGSDGREQTQRLHLNPRSGRWPPDNSHRQRHVGLAVAYNVWQYYQTTDDHEFLAAFGAEMLLEIARFFADLAVYEPHSGRYGIHGVMGPDEYHDGYPRADPPAGIDNNAYTNVLASWVLCRARDALDALSDERRRGLLAQLRLGRDELTRWDEVSRRLRVDFHDDRIISQFQGYADLAELDWAGYRRRYGDIQRLDRILEAEGDSPNRYKLAKQADVLMLFYLFSAEQLGTQFRHLGYPFEADWIPENVAYYHQRTAHGSSLSRVVHAWVLSRSHRGQSWALFQEALHTDYADHQRGTTREGIHLGAMAGTVDLICRGYTGLEVRDGVLWLKPHLPEEIGRLCLRLHFRGRSVQLTVTQAAVSVRLEGQAQGLALGLRDRLVHVRPGEPRVFPLRPEGTAPPRPGPAGPAPRQPAPP